MSHAETIEPIELVPGDSTTIRFKESHKHVAMVGSGLRDFEADCEVAARLVETWNQHASLLSERDALREALRDLREWVRCPWGPDDGVANELVISRAEAALALGEAKT